MQTVEQPRVTGEVRVEVDGREHAVQRSQPWQLRRRRRRHLGGGICSPALSAPCSPRRAQLLACCRRQKRQQQGAGEQRAPPHGWGSSSAGSRGAGSPTDQSIVLMQANWGRASLDLEPPRRRASSPAFTWEGPAGWYRRGHPGGLQEPTFGARAPFCAWVETFGAARVPPPPPRSPAGPGSPALCLQGGAAACKRTGGLLGTLPPPPAAPPIWLAAWRRPPLAAHAAAVTMSRRAVPGRGQHPTAGGGCRRRSPQASPGQPTRTAATARTMPGCRRSCRDSASAMVGASGCRSSGGWGARQSPACRLLLPPLPAQRCLAPAPACSHSFSCCLFHQPCADSPTCSVDIVSGISPSRPGCQHDANTRCSLCDLTVKAPVRRCWGAFLLSAPALLRNMFCSAGLHQMPCAVLSIMTCTAAAAHRMLWLAVL